MDQVVLCAGTHTRLSSECGEMPKCLLEFNGVPLLAHIYRQLEPLLNAHDQSFVVIRQEHVDHFTGFAKRFPQMHYKLVIDQMHTIPTPTSSLLSFISQYEKEVSDYLLIHYGDAYCLSNEFICYVSDHPTSNYIATARSNDCNIDSRRVVVVDDIMHSILCKSADSNDSIARWGGIAHLRKNMLDSFCPTSPLIEELLLWSQRTGENVKCVPVSALYNINSPEIYAKLKRGG